MTMITFIDVDSTILAKSLQIIRLARKMSICAVNASKAHIDTTKEEEQQHI